VAVGKVRVLLLKMTAIGQQDAAEIGGGGGAMSLAAEPVLHKQRQIAGVVDVSVGEDYAADTGGCHWRCGPIAQAQGLETLKQAAVNQNAVLAVVEQKFRASDGFGASEECQR
jgi:hypothetical protein